MYVESEQLELKEKLSDSVCKEIVAFLNTKGGKLIIGVNDKGEVVGVRNIDETARKLSDIITDQIEPNPRGLITIEVVYEEGRFIVVAHIAKGLKPVYYQKKYGLSTAGCFVRIGTTTKSMTEDEIHNRHEMTFIDKDLMLLSPAKYGNITLNTLKVYYANKGYHINDDAFEASLCLRTPDGRYNRLAELLSDQNFIPLIVVKFRGLDKSCISENYNYGNQCVLVAYERIINRIVAENICVSDTTVRPRVDKYLYDFDSVNEAVINALVHNDWNVSQPLIAYFDDRIEITSHGGLPSGQTREHFFKGVSRPRNDMLMQIFLAMGLTEHTGHGIPVITKKYGEDVFEITESYIKITIPFDREVMEKSKSAPKLVIKGNVRLSKTEKRMLEVLADNPYSTTADLTDDLGVNSRTIQRTFNSLQEKGLLCRTGSKKIGRWMVIKQEED
jgi:ATP-dependent DNA helicase RecG